ncbi:MAG: TlpA family protein disulfide reductase [Odoribacter sp.]|nr:TlpA family protein disulfide reductase [Odoribacter sp.]
MKYCILIAIIATLLSCRKSAETIVRLHVDGGLDVEPALITKDSTYQSALGADNSVEFCLAENVRPDYVIFFLGETNLLGYVEPGKSLELSVSFEDGNAKPVFSGEGAEICRFLNSGVSRFTPDYKLEEAEFLASLAAGVQRMYAEIDAHDFNTQFTALEKKRMTYNVYNTLPDYPISHVFATWKEYKPSENYYQKLNEVFTEDETLLDIQSYQDFIKKYVNAMIYKNGDEYDDLQYRQKQQEYIVQNLKNPQVIEYLIHDALYEHVKNNGIRDLQELLPVYQTQVKDAAKKAAFDELCGKWLRIAEGQPSPSFKYLDIHGKEVSLADLAGKYVYIDIWATWCGPCCQELPFLEKLEKKYKGKNIYFVSISFDQDRKAWEKMVKEKQLSGIQLQAFKNDDFRNIYMIPQFPASSCWIKKEKSSMHT